MPDFKTLSVRIVKTLLVIGSFYAVAIAEPGEKYAVYSALTVNFTRFTTWPPSVEQNSPESITICLVGNPALEDSFNPLAGKVIKDKILNIRYLNRFNNLMDCQVLYIKDLEKNKLLTLLNEIDAMPILTVGENADFIENGGMVGLELVDGKVSIKINLKATKKSNLDISSRVLKLATVIK